MAHQNVKKIDANSYTTAMQGFKFKIAHKRAQKGTWDSSYQAQRKKVIQHLQNMLDLLQSEELQDQRLNTLKEKKGQAFVLLTD